MDLKHPVSLLAIYFYIEQLLTVLQCDKVRMDLMYYSDGGNGNPADVNGQYGWHVELA